MLFRGDVCVVWVHVHVALLCVVDERFIAGSVVVVN